MTVTPGQVAVLRAILDGDEEAIERLTLDPDLDDGKRLPALISAAYVASVQRRFPPGWSDGDVVRFVGYLRARDNGAHENLSATAAEQMLLSTLRGEPMSGEFDDDTKSYAQVALLNELTKDLSEQELGTFVDWAREQANAWLAQHDSH